MLVKGKEKKIKQVERCITKLIWNVNQKGGSRSKNLSKEPKGKQCKFYRSGQDETKGEIKKCLTK